jgi:GGDEF domain-containing protein
MSHAQSNLVVLFADISNSTRLYETLGDHAALQLIDHCLTILKNLARKFGGRTVKTIGDEIMCVFPSAEAGLQAASEMQVAISKEPAHGATRLAVRIAFHYGLVIEEDGDVFGDTVNVAARLGDLAKAEQILTSQQTVDALPAYLRLGIRAVGMLPLKGKQEDVQVCEAIWQFGDDLTMMQGRIPPPAKSAGKFKLILGEREWLLDDNRDVLSIGRDAHSDVVVANKMASRQHARIERRREKVVLVDVSTNGTFVTLDGGAEMTVRREEVLLHGSGTLCFGQSAHDPDSEVLHFSCA